MNNNLDGNNENSNIDNELGQDQITEKEKTEIASTQQINTTVKKAKKPVQNGETRQWRVGTLSMGITLIALGLLLIFIRVYELPLMWHLMKWWPLLIIVIGLEMVVYTSLVNVRRGAVRFTYDFFSIILVVGFLSLSAGFYFVEASGVLQVAQRYLLANPHVVERDTLNYPVNDGVQRLALETESERITLIAYDGEEVRVAAVYKGTFISREEAENFADAQLVKQEQLGDTIYLKTYSPYYARHPVINHPMPEQEITVFVPGHIDVDILKAWGTLDIHMPNVKSNWDINIQGRTVNLYLNTADSVHLQAEISQQGKIEGNVKWDHFEEKDREDTDAEKPQVKAARTWGEGEYKITLRQASGTAVINIKNSD